MQVVELGIITEDLMHFSKWKTWPNCEFS